MRRSVDRSTPSRCCATHPLPKAERTLCEYNIRMSRERFAHLTLQSLCLLLGTLLYPTIHLQNANSQQQSPQDERSPALIRYAASEDQSAPGSNPLAVPPGTILPVRLNSTLSSAKCRKGQVITVGSCRMSPCLQE